MQRVNYTPILLSIKKNHMMLKILADQTLPLLELFDSPFVITRYTDIDSLKRHLSTHDILLCRSTLKVNATLLKHSSIRCVATASSGIDHIDSIYLKHNNIQLFDAKGCNAHAVADYVASTISWILEHDLLEKKIAAIIGFGHVGQQVSARLNALGFTVYHYDPLKATQDEHFHSIDLETVQACPVICLHADLHDVAPFATHGLINEKFLSTLSPQTVLINAARGGIVDETALLSSSMTYCTDVYTNEPHITPAIVDYATLCTPHIAGHTIEAKKNAVIALAQQIYSHFTQVPTDDITPYHPIQQHLNPQQSIEKNWLTHYNPLKETQLLKAATDKTSTFLTLRRAHQFRHDILFE
jgi:erythronate-4-phosphate dehydrogenase